MRANEPAGRALELATHVASVELPNPVMTAAGTSGHGAELSAYLDLSGLGAVVVKSLAAFAWPGNPPPRVCPVPGGMLNSVGLQGPGVLAWASSELPALAAARARVVVSLWGRRTEEYAEAARQLREAAGGERCVVAVEVNVSCPNLEDGSRTFAHSPAATAAAVEAARECGLPCWAKLSPATPDLLAVAAAALEAGASALTLVNTLPGLALDVSSGRPLLGGGGGGLSGPALHSVALRAVYECRRAFPEAGIVGVGGVSSGETALAMLMAGADAVQVGTATLAEPRAPGRVLEELVACCRRMGASSLRQLVARAHEVSDEEVTVHG